MIGLYVPGHSFLHRATAGLKFFLLAAILTGVFLVNSVAVLLAILVAALGLYYIVRFRTAQILATLRPLVIFLTLIVAFQAIFNSVEQAAIVGLRLVIAVLLASLLTYTTQTGEILTFFYTMLKPLKRFGINAWQCSLVLSLTIRSIPLVLGSLATSREAYAARGLKASSYAVVIPVVIRLIRESEAIGEAISARSLEEDPHV